MGRLSTAEAKKSPQSRKLLEEAAGLRRRASYLNRLAHTVRISKGCAPSERWTEKSGCYDPSMRRLESAEARAGRFIKQVERRRRSNTKMEAAENRRRRTEAYVRIAQENLPNPDDARSKPSRQAVYRGRFDKQTLLEAERIAGNVGGKRHRSKKTIYSPTQ